MDVELTTSQELVILPHTGVVVDRSNENEVAAALSELRTLKDNIAAAERQLREALAERAAVLGTKTLHIPELGKVEVKGGTRITWDAEKLEDRLRQAGAPENLIREIIVEQVSYKVDARRAERAARANPEYAEAIEACREEEQTLPTVSFSIR